VLQCGIDLEREVRLDAEPLRTVSVPSLDAALAIATIAAHVPFTGCAGDAWYRIRPANDSDYCVAGLEAASRRRRFDLAK
jgi:hypothetical protein